MAGPNSDISQVDALRPPWKSALPGVYAIINAVNGKIYVGSAMRLHTRWNLHRYELIKQRHRNAYFSRAFHKDPKAFYVEVIEELPNATKDERLAREQWWMNFFQSYIPAKGYNLSPTARSCQGVKHSSEARARVAASLRGRKMSPARLAQHTIAMRNRNGARKFTPIQREQQRQRATGVKKSSATLAKLSASLTGLRYPKRGKAIACYDSTGNLVRVYDAIIYASRDLNIHDCNVRAALRHPARHPKGFYFRRCGADVPQQIELPRRPGCKTISALDQNGQRVATYSSVREAAEASGAKCPNISFAARFGKPYTAAGYSWRYENAGT